MNTAVFSLVDALFLRPPGIVHEQGQVEDERVLQIVEKLLEERGLRFLGIAEGIQDIEALQGVLVRRVEMEELMLHQIGQR